MLAWGLWADNRQVSVKKNYVQLFRVKLFSLVIVGVRFIVTDIVQLTIAGYLGNTINRVLVSGPLSNKKLAVPKLF